MRPATSARALLLPRLVLPTDLRAAGLDADVARRAVAAGLWSQVLPRAWLSDAGPVERSDRQRAALDRAKGGGLLTGVDACLYWGMRDVPDDPQVHLLLESGRRLAMGPEVRLTRTRALPPRVHPRLPLVAPAQAVVQAANGRDLQTVRALVTAAVWDRHVDVASLSTALKRGPQRGSGACRIAVSEVAAGAASAPEAEAAAALLGRTPVPFQLNAEICLDGALLGVSDGWLIGAGIGWELDSVRHHGDRPPWTRPLRATRSSPMRGSIWCTSALVDSAPIPTPSWTLCSDAP